MQEHQKGNFPDTDYNTKKKHAWFSKKYFSLFQWRRASFVSSKDFGFRLHTVHYYRDFN